MNNEEVSKIGNQAVIAVLRVQMDALLSVLNEDKRTEYQTKLLKKTQNILDREKLNLSKEQFDLFKELFESGIIRNEINP